MEDIKDYLNYDEVSKVLKKYITSGSGLHEKKVSFHAETILHSLGGIYTASAAEHNMLQYSAMLHDIGRYINKKAHHKHTSYIILNDGAFDPMPYNLRSTLALVAAGHRKTIGEAINCHNDEEQRCILRLASILRLADALDHTHHVDVSITNIKIADHSLLLLLKGKDSQVVISRAVKKSDFFLKYFNLEVKIKNAE